MGGTNTEVPKRVITAEHVGVAAENISKQYALNAIENGARFALKAALKAFFIPVVIIATAIFLFGFALGALIF